MVNLMSQMQQMHYERPQGALPSNTEPNPREKVNSIMTRSGLIIAEPSPPSSILPTPWEEGEKEPETLIDEVLEKLRDPEKFLIPYVLQDLEVYNSLADSGARINLMPLSIYEKLGIRSLKPTRMTLELGNRSVALPKGIAQDVIVRVDKFNFLANFVIVDFEADPRVPIILGRPFLRTTKALVDLYKEKLTLRVGNEEVIIRLVAVPLFLLIPESSFPSSLLIKTSDSSLEEFADELALLEPFPLRNEDDNFDPKADLRETKYLMNQDPSTDSSPKTDIDIIDPILERFTDEPALVYSFPPGDDDDDIFDLKSHNEKWKKLLYGDPFNNTHSENEKDKDLKIESLIDDMKDDFFPLLLTYESNLPEESSEIATLLSSSFKNEDKVFNPGILILGGTQILHDESKEKDLKVNSLTKALLILVENNFLSHSSGRSSDRELLFFLESTVIGTLLSFSSENEDKVFNPGIPISKGVHSFTLGLSH
ncbi:reverse transcriptase domain-containing protein [Tanacetum coccineum]